ncbi:MAG: DegQ family serine endoprotease [Sulfuricella sp.]|nr:DegQ family serine endoprotease [Sulfuricella sp.]
MKLLKNLLIAATMVFITASVSAKDLPDFTQLVEKQGPAVVNISITQTREGMAQVPGFPGLSEDDPFFEFFRRFQPQMPRKGQPREYKSQSLGSGFIISSDGYILTNAHVVENADEVLVRLTDKQELKAKVIGFDRRTDIALLKIDATNLPKVAIGNPEQLKVGEWVAAIGSPFGFESSVTAGIVSAKGRSLPQENYVPFIQTDAAINPGNSGGPLFNLKGEVVGVNSQIYSRSGGYMGLAFAIPIDVAMSIADQLKSGGKVTRGWLGVMIQEMTKELAESFGLSKAQGALIANVEKNSPAEKGGLEVSDVVLKFDGKPVESSADLPRLVGAVKPGKKIAVQVWRKGETKDLTIAVGEAPAEKSAPSGKAGKNGKTANRIGLTLSEAGEAQLKEFKVSHGLFVEEADGQAAKVGIQRGDLILSINNRDVKSVEQFNQILSQFKTGSTIALLVRRGTSSMFVALRIE